MDKDILLATESRQKAIKYYRRWTLGLIPVTIILSGLVFNRTLKYINDDVETRVDE